MAENNGARRRFTLPIGAVLAAGFGGMILAAVGLVLLMGFYSATRSTESYFQVQTEALLDQLVGSLDFKLKPIARRADWVVREVQSGDLDLNDTEAWDNMARGFLAGDMQQVGLTGVLLFRADGESRVYRANDNMVHKEIFQRPPGLPDIVALIDRLGIKPGESRWNDPMLGGGRGQAVVSLLTPLYKDGEFLGVLGQGVNVVALSDQLKTVAEGLGVTPFVLFGGTRVLAHPSLARKGGRRSDEIEDIPRARYEGPLLLSPDVSPLPKLSEVDDRFLASMWGANEIDLPLMKDLRKSKARAIRVQGQPRIFVYREISSYGQQPWIVGAHFDVRLAREEVMRLILFGFAGLGVLLLAVFGAILLARWIGRPVRQLAATAQQIEAGDLPSVEALRPTTLRELNEAAVAFNRMVQGLRERNLIRELFGRYVPEAVANALVREQGGLTPQSSVGTVLFADLAGFTAMSERLEPPAIVDVLNGYFSAMVEIIEYHGGVVTQFQGDAILAIFNVPVADPAHAQKAVQAAVAMHRKVNDTLFAGQQLVCRIGINTGELVAGNVGASGRLSYTVHGDAVNVAARLEQLNKDYGTRLLVSGVTAERVEGIPFTALGKITVRGKAATIEVFTVDGDEKG